jgi:F420-non-reducing hydrogenase iron-sulfur subunit
MTSENIFSPAASPSEGEVARWEPQIVAFCCRHCAYAAADLAGGLRLAYPPSIKVFELPCTGRLDVLHVLRTFEDGADGVMVAG